ncbi:hypothetical protein EMGBS6_18150 [Opitutia bacterium]|nr:hypothetical protein EMGBS6_18150 [Opitutae bacterium]
MTPIKWQKKGVLGAFSPFQYLPPPYRPTHAGRPVYFLRSTDPRAALLLVLSRNAVTSAMGMILALVGVAAEFFLLDAYFLGVLQVSSTPAP